MSGDKCEGSGDASGQAPAQAPNKLTGKDLEKDRLAAALQENLKRRKAQISARRQGSAQNETAPK